MTFGCLVKSVIRPRPPVHRVLSVLEQIRAGRGSEAVTASHSVIRMRTQPELPGGRSDADSSAEGAESLPSRAASSASLAMSSERTDLSKLLPHAEVQKHHGCSQQQRDEQGRPTRLDPVGVDVEEDHAETLLAAGSAIPANRSSSGTLVSTRLRASSHSSVGHADLCTSSGTANHGPSGST